MGASPFLHIDQLTHQYPNFTLQPVSLEVKQGETVVIVGESGSGKSTLLRLVAGFETAVAGNIQLAGLPICVEGKQIPPEERNIGMVFQDYALFPHLRIEANIAFGLQKMGRKARKERVNEMLQFVGLQEYGRRYPHELSGGEQQRVALARALAPSPALLMFDEPFSNLDAVIHQAVRSELQQLLKAAGTTTLFVTHDINDAIVLADRIMVMRHGKVLQIGTAPELQNHPADPYVAQLLSMETHLSSHPRQQGEQTITGKIIRRQQTDTGEEITLEVAPREADTSLPDPPA